MKVNNKRTGLIIGLVCVLICLIAVLVTRCSAPNSGQINETSQPTGESTEATEATLTTEATTEPTEETTESTEETTEPTEETPGKVVTTNNSIGSPGTTGAVTDTTDPTEPTEVVLLDPGIRENPYTEVVAEYPSTMTTVKIPGGSSMYYNIYNTDGATLTVEDANAYVICGGVTYEAANGVVTVPLNCEAGAPASLQVGSKAKDEQAFKLSLAAPVGAPCNPEILASIGEVKTTLEAGNDNGYTYSWTAIEDGTVTFALSSVTTGVTCDVILTAGENKATLSENGVTLESTDAATGEKTSVQTVSLTVTRGQVLAIQVIASQNAQGTQYPAAEASLSGSFQLAYQLVENVSVSVGKNTVALGNPALAYVFRFRPIAAGTYTFTTSNAAAVLSYWGTDESAITNQTSSTDYDEEKNTFTITVDAGAVGKTYLIGVSGTGSCTLTIAK